jgi:PKD repeat protein
MAGTADLLDRFGRRRAALRALDAFLEAAFALGTLAAAILLVDRLGFELGFTGTLLGARPRLAGLLVSAFAVSAVLAAVRALRTRPPHRLLAYELDRAAGADQRLLSAVELAGESGPFSRALAADADRVAAAADPRRLLPRPPVGYRWGIALALGVGALLWTFPPVLHGPPRADFDADPLRGPAPLEVACRDASIGAIDEFAWDFGDGARAAGEVAVHAYAKPGRYTLTLTVRGPGGRSERAREVEVLEPGRVAADFRAVPLKGRAPLDVRFENLTRNGKRFRWDFGDGGVSEARAPAHRYRAPGLYTVKLRAENDLGADEKVREKLVKVAHPDEPIADFRAFPREGPAPLRVNFEDASEGELTSWRWDFGDLGAPDRVSEERNPEHVYTRPGWYAVTLRVRGPHGEDEEEKLRYIRVKDDDGSGGGGGGAAKQPKPAPPKAPGGLGTVPPERPRVTLVPEELKAHKPGSEMEEKTLNVYTGRNPGAPGAPEQVPLKDVVKEFRRAAEESIERELIPPADRGLVRRYYEGVAPK